MKFLNARFGILSHLACFLPSPLISRTHFMSHTFLLQPHQPPCSPFNTPRWLRPFYLGHVGTSQASFAPLFCLENSQSSLKFLFHLFTLSKSIFSPSGMSYTLLDLWYIEPYTRKLLSTHPMLYAAYQKRTHKRDVLYTSVFPHWEMVKILI